MQKIFLLLNIKKELLNPKKAKEVLKEKRNLVLNEMMSAIGDDEKKIKILLHSLAFGSLKPYLSKDSSSNVTKA